MAGSSQWEREPSGTTLGPAAFLHPRQQREGLPARLLAEALGVLTCGVTALHSMDSFRGIPRHGHNEFPPTLDLLQGSPA